MADDGLIKVLHGITSIEELRKNIDTTSIIGGFSGADLIFLKFSKK